MSPGFAHIRGWNAGVYIQAVLVKGEPDQFRVFMTRGSNGGGPDILLGTVTDTPEGPKWEVAR
jgi:hypothetical protein